MNQEIEKIWTGFHHELRAFVMAKTRHKDDSEDILQDVFVRIMQNFDKVSASVNIKHYIYGMVKNAVSDYFRHKNKILKIEDTEEPFAEAESETLNATVAECCLRPFIEKLPVNYREALIASEIQQVSQKDLAQKLGISYSGTKSRVQRGKEKLKALIQECCNYESDIYGNLTGSNKENCNCS